MWKYKNKEFTSDDIKNHYGFVYCITNTTNGKKYIGRKYFYSKKTLPPLKGKVRKRKIIKESNWKTYYGSSKILIEDINTLGKENFEREIISLHPNKAETNYSELAYQVMHNVLEARDDFGERIYYNANILQRYYPSEKFGYNRIVEHENRLNEALSVSSIAR